MIPIILADDERLELEHIRNMVDYAALGLEIVATCRTGKELLCKIEELNPQIVLTDIIMPELSGLEVARAVHKSGRKTKMLFITGHQSFQYVQTAMELGVCHYLLKPVLPEQLEQALHRLAEECIADNRAVYEQTLFREQLEQNMPLLRDIQIRKLISNTMTAVETAPDKLAFYGIHLAPDPILALVILPEPDDSPPDPSVARLALQNAAEQFLHSNRLTFCWKVSANRFTLLLNPPNNTCSGWSVDFAARLQSAVLTGSGIAATVGVGVVVSGFERVPHSVACAERALEARFFVGERQVIAYDDIADGTPAETAGIRRMQRVLCDAVKSGDAERLPVLFDELCYQCEIQRVPAGFCTVFSLELLSAVLSEQFESGGFHEDSTLTAQYYMELLSADGQTELFSRLERILRQISRRTYLQMADRSNEIVRRIRQIIDEQYSQSISIDSIAAQIYVSSGYAARLFRKLTGASINSYIIAVRMQKAAALLRNPESKIGDIATLVGYQNIAYFSSVFRKQYGCTPRLYREQHQWEAEE